MVVQVLQVQITEDTVETPDIQTVQGTQKSENLGTAPVRHVKFAETVEMVEFEPPLPAKSVPPFRVTDTRGRCASCGGGARPT